MKAPDIHPRVGSLSHYHRLVTLQKKLLHIVSLTDVFKGAVLPGTR